MVSVKISIINIPIACEQLSEPGELCFNVQENALKSIKNDSYGGGCCCNHSSIHSGHSINVD